MVKTITLYHRDREYDLLDSLCHYPWIWKKGNVNLNFHPFNSTEPDPSKISKEDKNAARLSLGFFMMKEDITPKLQKIINKELKGVHFYSEKMNSYLISVMELTQNEFYIELGIDFELAYTILHHWKDKILKSMSVTNLLIDKPVTFKLDSEKAIERAQNLLMDDKIPIHGFDQKGTYEVKYRCISQSE